MEDMLMRDTESRDAKDKVFDRLISDGIRTSREETREKTTNYSMFKGIYNQE